MQKVTRRLLDKMLEFLYEENAEFLQIETIETTFNAYDKRLIEGTLRILSIDEYVKLDETENKGINYVTLKDEGIRFITTNSYRRKFWEEFPKKYWLLTDTIKVVIGILLGLALRK